MTLDDFRAGGRKSGKYSWTYPNKVGRDRASIHYERTDKVYWFVFEETRCTAGSLSLAEELLHRVLFGEQP